MHIDHFNYQLPPELIAYYPLENRSSSRLLCMHAFRSRYYHRHFYELVDLLKPHDLLVFNNSRVMPARLFGKKPTGGQVEILIERIIDNFVVLALVRSSKPLKMRSQIELEKGFKVEVLGRDQDLYRLHFLSDVSALSILDEIGHIPLPLYIDRADEDLDKERYQTVYSRILGSVAAPTAGLHFTTTLLTALQQKKIETAFVTLHVGSGTFQPVRTENITEHVMHHEYIDVSQEVVLKVQEAKAKGGRIIAVGTTSVRCLETASRDGVLKPYQGETNLFIYPGYQFNQIDAIITNFHAPKSSLLMLVSAFAGLEPIQKAYKEAILQQYRFFSYGDAMLISRFGIIDEI